MIFLRGRIKIQNLFLEESIELTVNIAFDTI